MMQRKKRLRPWVYVVIFTLPPAILLLALYLNGSFGATISTETVPMEMQTTLVIARDELTATSESYGKIIFYAKEGQAVTPGERVARVYKWGYNDNVLQDLNTLEQQINSYQNEVLLADIVDRELDSINQSIAQKEQEIASSVNGEKLDLLTLKDELDVLLQSRAKYLNTTVQPDEALQEMYSQRDEYILTLDTWKRDVLSTGEGLISFYFDGYEVLVNKQMIEQLQPKDVSSIIAGKPLPNAQAANPDERPMYRLVNPNEFYVLAYTKKGDTNRLCKGETYEIAFNGFYDKTYKGECVMANTNDGGIYAIRVKDDVSEFLSLRTAKATLTATFTGLCANTKLIVKNEDNQDGIYVKIGSEKRFVPIQIMHMGKKKTIFKTDDPGVVPGVRYVKG